MFRFLDQIKQSKKAQEALRYIAEISQDRDVYLICSCKPGENCHRFFLLDVVNGINIYSSMYKEPEITDLVVVNSTVK
jgi:Protein of unknown function, DUF488